ncbi:MAG: hypothetical protein HYX34_12505 [Actinobacteria bacterium]|nr:hypothetical protein [Actinomycetota bacterium]
MAAEVGNRYAMSFAPAGLPSVPPQQTVTVALRIAVTSARSTSGSAPAPGTEVRVDIPVFAGPVDVQSQAEATYVAPLIGVAPTGAEVLVVVGRRAGTDATYRPAQITSLIIARSDGSSPRVASIPTSVDAWGFRLLGDIEEAMR